MRRTKTIFNRAIYELYQTGGEQHGSRASNQTDAGPAETHGRTQGLGLVHYCWFPPAIKIDGEVRTQADRVLTPEQSAVLVRSIMNDRQTRDFDSTKECNFAIAPPGIGRFRVSAFVQQGNMGCVVRLINSVIPTLDDMELPVVLKDVVMSKRGLVIVVGGTGSGKSTSLAAMLNLSQ